MSIVTKKVSGDGLAIIKQIKDGEILGFEYSKKNDPRENPAIHSFTIKGENNFPFCFNEKDGTITFHEDSKEDLKHLL